jgi:hypothetical protein
MVSDQFQIHSNESTAKLETPIYHHSIRLSNEMYWTHPTEIAGFQMKNHKLQIQIKT